MKTTQTVALAEDKKMKNRSSFFCYPCFCRLLLTALWLTSLTTLQAADQPAKPNPDQSVGIDPDDGTAPRSENMLPPRLIPNPGSTEDYARAKRTCTGVPSIAVSRGGRIWAAWYSGKTPGEIIERCPHSYTVLSTSGDGGRTWTSSGLLDTTRFSQPYVSPSHPPDDAALLAPTLLFNMNKTLAIKLAVPMGYRTHGTVFAGTAAGLFRSTDHGLTWLPLSHFLLPEDAYIEAVSVSPAYEDDRTVVVSVRGHGSLMSQDGGENFVHFARELDEAGYPLANYEGNTPPFAPIVFSPGYATDHAVYAFSGPHLFKSSDHGLSWAELDTPSADWRDRLRVWYSSSGRRDKFLLAAGGTALPLFLMLGISAARWVPSRRKRKQLC